MDKINTIDLESWIRKKNMTTNKLVELIGCSRPTLWKAKRGVAICPKFGRRIIELTQGEVYPKMRAIGGRS